jgi:hypothetical protein
MIESVEEGYNIYLVGCANRKKWLKKCMSTWYKKFFFHFLQKQTNNDIWIGHLIAMEKVLNLSEEEKKIFD